MRIEVTRSGGFAGMTVRAEVDTDELDDGDVFVQLAVRGGWGNGNTPQLGEHAAPLPDDFVWTISVDARATRVPGTAMPPPVRDLAERTLAEGRRLPPPQPGTPG